VNTLTARDPLSHTDKPWGWEQLWARGPGYAAKLLFVRAGHRLSLQRHERKHETLLLTQGRATVEHGGRSSTAVAGDRFEFPPGLVHRLTALTDCLWVEVSTAELEDVVRLEDDYGRR
jgi:mannose-1-phosphate guanylyltransferase